MIQINLLPIRDIQRRAKAKKEMGAGGLILALFLVLLAVVGIILASSVKNLETELRSAQEERRGYDSKLKEIDDMKKQKELLQQRIAVIEKLKQDSSTTVHVLDDVATRTPPDRIWLTDINKSGSSVQIVGMSLDNQTVAKYMLDLGDSPYISSVSLVNSSTRSYADRELKAFTLNTSVTVPPREQPATQQ